MSKRLTEHDYEEGARRLGVDRATVEAVADVESAGSGFLPDGRPKLLFERHHFHRLTGGRFSGAYPDISNPRPGGYAGGVSEYARFDKAASLDEAAAIKATSWGKFQIMGFNYVIAGYESLDSFREAMEKDEREHLLAFCDFVKGSHLADELRRKDWAGFAEGYNGRAYKKNHYDTKLAAAYKKHAGIPAEPVAVEPDAALAAAGSTVNVDQAGAVNVTGPTPTPPVAVEGGGPNDPPVKANKSSLISKTIAWAGSSLSLSVVADWVTKVTGFSPEAQLLIVKAIIGFGALAIVVMAVDHIHTKWTRSRGDLANVK